MQAAGERSIKNSSIKIKTLPGSCSRQRAWVFSMLGCTLSEGFLSGQNTANFFFQRDHPFSPWWKSKEKAGWFRVCEYYLFPAQPSPPQSPLCSCRHRRGQEPQEMTPGAPMSFKVSPSGTFEIECFILSLLFLSLSPECHLWTRLASFQSWDKAHCLKEGIRWNSMALLFIWRDALVCEGCHKQVPQTGWPKEQKLFFSKFWRLDVQDRGVSRAVFPEVSLLGL